MNGLSRLGDFIALDFETTGITPESDTIIEIGAIHYQDGEEVNRFVTLVNPGRPVSGEITQLTGITNEALQDAPTLAEVRDSFAAFLGERPIMAHNAAFELAFLRHAFGAQFERPMIDTYELLIIMYPLAPSHSLEYFIRRHGLRDYEHHRGLQDALDMVEIVRCADRELESEDYAPLTAIIRHWMGGTPSAGGMTTAMPAPRSTWSWLPFFDGRHPDASIPAYRNFRSMYEGKTRPSLDGSLSDAPQKLGDPEFFRRVYPKYKLRADQRIMAAKASEALREGGVYVAEAGTGIGKTLAYSTAALAALDADDESPVLISTHTKMLQNQFMEQELPRLKELFQQPKLRATSIKGINNYACLRKIVDELPENQGLVPNDDKILLGAVFIEHWLQRTVDGEIDELPRSLYANPLVSRIIYNGRATSRDCSGKNCAFYENCFYHKKRWEAEASHILAVNHALLLTYPASYPHFNRLVVDEADELRYEAIEAFSRQVTHNILKDRIATFLEPNGLAQRNLLAELEGAEEGPQRQRLQEHLHSIPGLLSRVSESLAQLDATLRSHKKDEIFTLQFTLNEQWLQDEQRSALTLMIENCKLALVDVAQVASDLAKAMKDRAGSQDQAPVAEFSDIAYRAEEFAAAHSTLAAFLSEDERNFALYMRVEDNDWAIVVAPFNIGGLFAERLLNNLHGAVFTSATISSTEDMHDFAEACGLELIDKSLTKERYPSPFNYRENARVVFVKGFPSNNNPKFPQKAAETLSQIALMLEGKTLVLFTSKDRLRRTHEELLPILQRVGISVISHGITNMSISRCVEQFAHADRAVLMGARGMWKGVDIPGDALQCVVVDKMPYAVPSPYSKGLQNNLVERYRGEALDLGETPDEQRLRRRAWNETDKPQMFQAFRQMFGRLIRSETDRGVMIVLDPQLQGPRLSPRHQELMRLLPDVPHRLVFPEDALRELEFLLPEY